MAGTIISLWTARDFDFSSLGVGNDVTFDVGPVTGVLPFRDALFLLRVHDVTITGSAKLDFSVHSTAPSQDDPAGTFVATQAALSLSVAGSSSGDLLRGLIPASILGAHIRVRGTALQSIGSTETIQARISAALVGRR
jgi:hypothetical protein